MPYYTSIKRGIYHGFLSGPFRTHQEALALVDDARHVANRINHMQAVFAGFGTCSGELFTPGVINDHLGVEIDPETGYARIVAPLKYTKLALEAYAAGVEWDKEKYFALESDQRKVEDYIERRIRHSGCRGWLSTPEMQQRYPHINNQEIEL